MSIPTGSGWAVIENNSINVRTVSDTRREAIVNWLCVEKNVLLLQIATDEDIERKWHDMCGRSICTTVEINVSPR